MRTQRIVLKRSTSGRLLHLLVVGIIASALLALVFCGSGYGSNVSFSDTVLERAIEFGHSIIKVRVENTRTKKEDHIDLYIHDVKVLKVLFGNYSKKKDSLCAGPRYASALSVGRTYIIFASERGGWVFLDNVMEVTDPSLETQLARRADIVYSKTKLALKNLLATYLGCVVNNDYDKLGDFYFDEYSRGQQQFAEIRKTLQDPEIITTWKNGNFGYGLVVNKSTSGEHEPFFFYFLYKNNHWNLVYDSVLYSYPETSGETEIPKVDWEYIAPFDPETLKKVEAEKEYLKSAMIFLRYLVSRESYITISPQHLSFLSGAENELVLRKYLTSVQPCGGLNFIYESDRTFETTIGEAIKKILTHPRRNNPRISIGENL